MGPRAWLLALRPKTLTAAVVPVVVGTAVARADGLAIIWWASFCALFSSCFIQIGTNFVNDALDFKKGADTETRIGPRRMTQSGHLTHRQVMAGGFVCFGLAFLLGIPLVIHGGWPIVAIGLTSLLLGYAYTGGPYPLAYIGLGDLFVILYFGLIAVGGTYYLHAGRFSTSALVAGLQIGALAAVLIAVNNLRDSPQDRIVGKKTLAVRFGETFARIEIAILVVLPFVLGLYWSAYGNKNAAMAPVLAIPLARRVVAGVFKNPPGPIYNRFLAMAAGSQLIFGLAIACSLWWR